MVERILCLVAGTDRNRSLNWCVVLWIRCGSMDRSDKGTQFLAAALLETRTSEILIPFLWFPNPWIALPQFADLQTTDPSLFPEFIQCPKKRGR